MDGGANLAEIDVFKSGDIQKCEKWNLQTRTDQVWGPPSLHFKENLGSLLVLTRPERDVNRSPPSRTEVQNEWS
jgi:hypothetical protein